MLYELCAIAAVLIFGILAWYLIRTLISAKKTLERISHFTLDLDVKLNKIDSTIQSLSNLGDICEKKTSQLREEYFQPKFSEYPKNNLSEDLASLLFVCLKLGGKFLRRK